MVRETDNSKICLDEIKDKIQLALNLTGEVCEGYAKISTSMGGRCPVDTGLLKNSICYATKTNGGGGYVAASDDGSKQITATLPTPDEYTLEIGSAVKYASVQEAKHGFLIHSVSDHKTEIASTWDMAFKTK